MFGSIKDSLLVQPQQIRDAGLHKVERVITTPQGARVGVLGQDRVVNFCANNYLGLADHPEVIAAAHEALDRWGYGMASVRFICGTQQIHKQLEDLHSVAASGEYCIALQPFEVRVLEASLQETTRP